MDRRKLERLERVVKEVCRILAWELQRIVKRLVEDWKVRRALRHVTGPYRPDMQTAQDAPPDEAVEVPETAEFSSQALEILSSSMVATGGLEYSVVDPHVIPYEREIYEQILEASGQARTAGFEAVHVAVHVDDYRRLVAEQVYKELEMLGFSLYKSTVVPEGQALVMTREAAEFDGYIEEEG